MRLLWESEPRYLPACSLSALRVSLGALVRSLARPISLAALASLSR